MMSAPTRWKPALFSFALVVFALGSCTRFDPNFNADTMAHTVGMSRQLVTTDNFVLTAFVRLSHPDQPLNIYIEGDGSAWQSRDQPSSDPTPRQPLGLALAASDPAANVIYLARPCQFTRHSLDTHCSTPYWTSKRFAPEVVASMNQAITHFTTQTPGQRINLVGYSGGAAIAILIAASRTDIATLRTVAGNLDSEAFNHYHNVSAMPDSLNPVSVAPRLKTLPQEHFIGDNDDVIPPSISESFMKAMGNTDCATITHVKNATHGENWLEFWHDRVLDLPVCGQ